MPCVVLYLIEFLHQTTTFAKSIVRSPRLYLIEFLHQTTTVISLTMNCERCILLNFYIKPQHISCRGDACEVVSY